MRRTPAKANDDVNVGCLWAALYPNFEPEAKRCLLVCASGGCEEATLTRMEWVEPKAEEQGDDRTIAKWVPPEVLPLIILLKALRLSPHWSHKTTDEQRSEAVRLATTHPCAGFAKFDKETGAWYLVRSRSAIRSLLEKLLKPDHPHTALEHLLFTHGTTAAFGHHPMLTDLSPQLCSC